MTKLCAFLGAASALFCFAVLPASAEYSGQLIYQKNDAAAGDWLGCAAPTSRFCWCARFRNE